MRADRRRLAGAACASALVPTLARTASGPGSPVSGDARGTRARFAEIDALLDGFVRAQDAPGAALAVAQRGRLIHARGFGRADRASGEPVRRDSLFRIASVSKPFTATAVLQLVDRGTLALDARVWDLLALAQPADPRWKRVTVAQLLNHTGGWDRDRSFDPMFASARIAQALAVPLPVDAAQTIRYMLGQPLDFDPGARFAYSNFGYCLLGRVVERVSGQAYEQQVRRAILAPTGIRRMRLGRTSASERAPGEVAYHVRGNRRIVAVAGDVGAKVGAPYGLWSMEAHDANGGWLASAPDLLRFVCALDSPSPAGLLGERSLARMFDPSVRTGRGDPEGARGQSYGCGWRLRRPGAGTLAEAWHTGHFHGTSALLVRRHDATHWAVLFNGRNGVDGRSLAQSIHRPLDDAIGRLGEVRGIDLFPELG